ncbi:lantibiotic protection ABC transporter ATP-binding protein [Clostridium senegalense]|uniref:Lantibiotic protection ABC transporter ATP-binding protein n=1 Tax=Clostridium senegalense TaxID=1465809 RepID=A0A6M0H122_9CLOT|nr:lantibiotic protection ABC transporter ATP-binding protein [Clostridium senegalense]NEU04299.1 lantibiotic protection ABC transporter ATP-binding protein [Clostridium senegalense]
MSEYIVQTKKLTKKFKNQLAVKDVNLNIKSGKIYGLLGPNGAGKSTTLKMLTGLLHPTSGEIYFDGHPWTRNDLKDIGVLIESPALYGNLTAVENLKVHAKLLNVSDRRIEEVLEIVGLKNTGKKRASQFSLGMKQRLGIAIALLNNPKLLILDEPTNGLDPVAIQELRDMIRFFAKEGITVILSSHILSEVQQVADYIGIINDGNLMYENEIKKDEDLESLFMNVITRKIG